MKRPSENGFSLIEVIVALALLAAVLLTISGLFIQGGQSVGTGRDLTEATSLATDILEQMDKWSYTQLYTNFCHVATDTEITFYSNVEGTTCATFRAIPLAGNINPDGWQSKISARLPNAFAKVVVTPLGQSQFLTGATPPVACKGIRVQVTIDWTLKLKRRTVSLETVRF